MNAAMAMSPAQWDEVNQALAGMDPKTGKAFLRLCGYLRRFGTVPSGERALASILGVTAGFLRRIAWPLLEAWLEITPDGQRYFIPEITGARSQRTPEPVREKSERHVKAANGRWHADASNLDASTHASMHEGRMQPDAKTDAKSTTDASDLHANSHDFASDASPMSDKKTLPSSASYQPSDSSKVSKDGAVFVFSAPASADAAGMQTSMPTDASGDAKPHASGDAKPRRLTVPSRTRITAEWQPAPAVAKVCADMLPDVDLAGVIASFVDHHLSEGTTKLDWNATFRGYCRIAVDRERQRRQMPLVRSIAGNRPDKGAELSREVERLQAKYAAQNRDEGGPIIEGVAS